MEPAHRPPPPCVSPAPVDLTEFVRPSDTVHWQQAAGEPLALTSALAEQRAKLGGIQVFLGLAFSETFAPDHADHITFRAVGGFGTNGRLFRAGVLEVIPCHVSAVPRLIAEGVIRVDVLFLHVSPADRDGYHSLGVVTDHMRPAIAGARTVIAQVNDRMPRTLGDSMVHESQFAHTIACSHPLARAPGPVVGPRERTIGALVAERIADGSTLQFGIGSIPEAVCEHLAAKRDLGIHSGVIGDGYVHLAAEGVITNARKPIDAGRTVTATVLGGDALYRHVHENPSVEMRSVAYTHSPAVIARLPQFVSINSALEVDLTGQVNAETVGGRRVGAVGGAVDFVRGSALSPGGQSIIALPAASRDGTRSRIVGRLSSGVTSTPRSDVDLVVTEFGVAELRGRSLRERARALISIADPRFQDELSTAGATVC